MTRIQDDVENNMSLNVPTPSKQKAVPPQPQPQPVSGSSLPLRDQTNTPTEFYPGPQNTRHLAPPAELTIVSSSQDEEQDTSDAEEQQAISGNNGFDYSEYSDMDVSDDDQGYDEEGDCEDDEMEDDNPVSDYSEEEEGEDEEEEDANETNDNSNNNINATGSRLLFMGISTGTELKYRPEPNYIVTRTCNFNDNHRKMLVDWLIEVAHECRYKQQTLHLAINYLDRFLSSVGSRIMRDKLQLAGSVCMFLATKYEEITPMLIQDIVFLTADTYTREQVLAMEALVLNELRFCLTVVTANDFLELIFSQFNPQPAVMALAMMLADLTLQEYAFVSAPPSMIATCAYALACHALGVQAYWGASAAMLYACTGYSPADLRPCLDELLRVYTQFSASIGLPTLQAIADKYSTASFLGVALTPPPASIPPLYQ